MEDENNNKSSDSEILQNIIVNMAVESWRFGRVFIRMATKLDAGDQNRFRGQYQWFAKKIEESLEGVGLKLVNIEGQQFDPGMAATPLNIDDFSADDLLVVDQMLEPIIMGSDGVVKTGTVTLRRIQSE